MRYRATHMALDGWREPRQGLRIAVEGWRELGEVRGQYIERPRSVWMLWNYIRRVGLRAVVHKIRSRLAEQGRNRKVVAVGVGRVLEAPPDDGWRRDERVVFFACNHPPDPERLTLDERFVLRAADVVDLPACRLSEGLPAALQRYVGWSPYAGWPAERKEVHAGLAELKPTLQTLLDIPTVTPDPGTAVRERLVRPTRPGGLSAVLFGLGNYAKTQIMPNLADGVELACIHEVDPEQLASVSRLPVTLDTSPWPHEDECYDAWFIAGYHHTHASLAAHAIRQGAYAVVEKPLVTTWSQYREICSAIETADEQRLFVCFHKRYSKLNRWAQRDLAVAPGEPVDMHCIVYEIPLPRLHWYNWPNSGSRLISNGCHWLDYFLFMNDYCPVVDAGVWQGRGRDLVVSARLDNGAALVMSLTDTGSARLGVRDLIELRARDVTVRMTDASLYEAESTIRVLRKRRVNPMNAYGHMYRTICRRIACGMEGDSLESLRSTELMLTLEDELQSKRCGRPAAEIRGAN